ncbi:MarR family transcriptional regulator [Paenarthrobacter sp. OM7]|uniref:MarR family winged helix-turn-helix transcriptional regulator n=1 Tax=Micrococcaceae TaxID=1268 RepID=UPI001A97E83C|nr:MULTISPECIES: MarR family transcriptional regulator [Micrococcaceae]QSZ49961.1 MarR family transcriptional regulator [Arthrobacter sp. D5-1]WGM19584.1 MarR family transcriptional regulator [Paenarthrobacter sp. OM7]
MQNHQKATGGLDHPASRTLQGLFSLANETEREVARTLGLNLTDYRALTVLADSGPVTVGALAAELGATAATTTALVSRLESHGYVERMRSTEDRRQVRVNVTSAAAGKVKDLMLPLLSAASQQLDALPPERQAFVTDFLDAVLNLMQDHLQSISTEGAR